MYILPFQLLQSCFLISSLVLLFYLYLDLRSSYFYLDIHTKQYAVQNITVFYMCNTRIGQMFTKKWEVDVNVRK